MLALGLPDFGPVQNNVSFNAHRGATRGIHTEPWDKFVSVATGRVFGAWVDMREGDTFGATFTVEIDPSVAVFVPRGVGNSYQTLEDGVAYTYLVNEHWRPGVRLPRARPRRPHGRDPLADPARGGRVSEKDRTNPMLDDVAADRPEEDPDHRQPRPAGPRAAADFPDADLVDLDELDVTDPAAVAAWPLARVRPRAQRRGLHRRRRRRDRRGRRGRLGSQRARPRHPGPARRRAPADAGALLHASTSSTAPADRHTEDEPLSPLGVYAQSKAAGDLAVGTATRHYLLRTSWVIGDGKQLRAHHAAAGRRRRRAQRGRRPGRPAHVRRRARPAAPGTCCDSRRAVRHLQRHQRRRRPRRGRTLRAGVFELSGRDADDVTAVTTDGVRRRRRPRAATALSTLSLAKLEATGFEPEARVRRSDRYLAAAPPRP